MAKNVYSGKTESMMLAAFCRQKLQSSQSFWSGVCNPAHHSDILGLPMGFDTVRRVGLNVLRKEDYVSVAAGDTGTSHQHNVEVRTRHWCGKITRPVSSYPCLSYSCVYFSWRGGRPHNGKMIPAMTVAAMNAM